MAYHMKIKEVANFLGCSRRTVERRVEQGLLDGKQHGPALTSPTMIPTEQVIALVNLRRDMVVVDAIRATQPNVAWERQVHELNRRAGKLAEVIGRDPITEMLKQYGVARFDELHPNQLRSAHGSLLRLAQGRQPYVRTSGNGGVQGVSVREEGEERRRLKRAANRDHPGQRGRPRLPPGTPEQEAERERSRRSAGAWAKRAREALARERDSELKQAAWQRKA
jgi:hypothetical protein